MEIQITNLGRGRGGYNGNRPPVQTPRANVPREDTSSSDDELSNKGDITPVQEIDIVINMLRIHNIAMLAQSDTMQTIVKD
jgi:hypothetical protein